MIISWKGVWWFWREGREGKLNCSSTVTTKPTHLPRDTDTIATHRRDVLTMMGEHLATKGETQDELEPWSGITPRNWER